MHRLLKGSERKTGEKRSYTIHSNATRHGASQLDANVKIKRLPDSGVLSTYVVCGVCACARARAISSGIKTVL